MIYPTVLTVIPVPAFTLAKVKLGVPPKVTISPVSSPNKAAAPVASANVEPSYTLFTPAMPVIVNAFGVISADRVGCVKIYFPASAPERVYPVVLTVMSVPTLTLAKVKVGDPDTNTSSPETTPDKLAVPETDPAVVPSYTLSSADNPVIIRFIGDSTVKSSILAKP